MTAEHDAEMATQAEKMQAEIDEAKAALEQMKAEHDAEMATQAEKMQSEIDEAKASSEVLVLMDLYDSTPSSLTDGASRCRQRARAQKSRSSLPTKSRLQILSRSY
jgi:mannose/fructose-specific phosphotransferase system component IIA